MPAITIARFTDEILSVYRAKDRARSTIGQVQLVLRELEACGARRTSDFTVATIAAWKNAHGRRSAATSRAYLRVMSALCTYAAFNGYLKRDPFELYSPNEWVRDDARPKPPRRRYHLSPEEIRRVHSLAVEEALGGDWEAERRLAYFLALFLTGGRPGEIQHILARNVDHAAGTITIEPAEVTRRDGTVEWWRPKTVGSSAVLPAGPRLLDGLARWERVRLSPPVQARYRIPIRRECPWLFPGKSLVGPWTGGAPGVSPLDQLKDLGRRTGVPHLVNKSARKSAGANAKAIGLGGLERRALFRHSDVRTGDYYDDDRVDSLRPAVDKLERYYLGGTGT